MGGMDWMANMLLLDPSRMYVVEPSGRGIGDAKAFRLTPAMTSLKNGWDDWYEWKQLETQPRYYRYLKFRLRGWQPYDKCFRYFMANEIVRVLQKDENKKMPMWLFLSEKLEDASKRAEVQKNLLDVLEEDITRGYFQETKEINAQQCGVKDERAWWHAKSTLRGKDKKYAGG